MVLPREGGGGLAEGGYYVVNKIFEIDGTPVLRISAARFAASFAEILIFSRSFSFFSFITKSTAERAQEMSVAIATPTTSK